MPEPGTSISVFGITLPIQRWTTFWFSVIAVLGVAGFVGQKLWKPEEEILTLREAQRQMAFSVSEYGRHMLDEPHTSFIDPDGLFSVRAFKDHCVIITRKVEDKILSKLIPDLTLDGTETVRPHESPRRSLLEMFQPTLEAQGGRCLTVHPGQFNSWYGSRNGCWVQVWRQWPDSCSHYQVMNACTGYFETNRDGTPLVHWQKCVH